MDTLGESTVVALKSPKGIPARLETLPGHVCVVGGLIEGNVVERYDELGRLRDRFDVSGDTKLKFAAHNFYQNWIAKESLPGNEQLTLRRGVPLAVRAWRPDYSLPLRIVISDSAKMSVFDSSDKEKNYKKDDGGFLYIPEAGKVCFFGTNRIRNADIDGIDNDVFTNEDDDRYIINKIPACSAG